jgi:tetratricopeptide (TPR) repeat protein
LLQRAEILLRLGQYTECAKTLGQLPAERRQDPQALVLRAEMAVREAQAIHRDQSVADREPKAREKYAAAMQLLRRIEETADERAPARSKATYLLGLCLMETGDAPGAIHEFFQTRSTESDLPEVLAANLCEAELHHGLGQNDESLAAYCRALAVAGDPEHYNNPYVPLEELRRRTLDAYRQQFDARNYRWCDTLVQCLSPVFPLDRSLQLSADTGRAWARDLLAQSERLPAAQAAPLEKQARAVLCRVALAHRRSAKLHFTDRSYPDDLWDSAMAYLEGRDYQSAVRMFQQYLREEVRRRNPQGWTNLGEALLALDRPDDALSALNKCIDFYPRDAASFRARLLAGRAYVDNGDMARAERRLRANLDGELLTPASKEWRDSLFALGELLYRTGRYDEAMRRLEEAVQRYPDSRPALYARYLLADSHRQLAKAESAKLAQDAVESTRIARSNRIRGFLRAALDGFRQTEDLLVRSQETSEPTPSDKALLRNCGFAIGSLLFDLGQYDAAIKTYTQLANRQPDAPESLDAYLQIARAYRQLDNQAEARAALKQAQAVLARMKPQVALRETTNRSRQEWEETLRD